MTKERDLCKPCAEKLKDGGFAVKEVRHGVNQKVICAECRRKRFGATYAVESKRRSRDV